MMLSRGDLVRVLPQYGWGWTRQGARVEEPPPFTIEITEASSEPGPIVGAVRTANHPLTGLWVSLYRRTGGPQPTFTLLAHREPPALLGLRGPQEAPSSIVQGYAMIEDA